MIKNITGNLRNEWNPLHQKWSPNKEAGERVCRVERFLSDKGYEISKDCPVMVYTDRIILNDKMLQSTAERSISDIVAEEVKKTDSSCKAGNLNMLIWHMRNLKPQCSGGYHWGDTFYQPGRIRSRYYRYKTDNPAEISGSLIELEVRTYPDFSHSLKYCDEADQVLFNLGSTNKLIVDVWTHDNELGEEILRVAHEK